MKANLLKPLLYSLPVLVLVVISAGKKAGAQEKKEEIRTVTITNGDTTVNGRQFSKISKSERDKLREDLKEMELKLQDDGIKIAGEGGKRVTVIRRSNPEAFEYRTDSNKIVRREFRRGAPGDGHLFRLDENNIMVEIDSLRGTGRDSARFHGRVIVPRDLPTPMPNMIRVPRPRVYGAPGAVIGGSGRNNSQWFNFNNTDKDGISTNISISVSDASPAKVKEIVGKEVKGGLQLDDLSFAPRFSSGKISIMFNLPTKGTAEVKLYDGDKKVLLTERVAGGSVSRQIALPKNGVYFLVVNQNGQYAVKRIVKQ